MNARDRVSYTFGMKMPGPEKYSMIDFSVSFSSDVKSDETPVATYERVRKFVHDRSDEEYERIEKIRGEA